MQLVCRGVNLLYIEIVADISMFEAFRVVFFAFLLSDADAQRYKAE